MRWGHPHYKSTLITNPPSNPPSLQIHPKSSPVAKRGVTDAFVKESAALNLTVTTAVKPFSVCYAAGEVTSTRVGPAVPTVDLVMQSDDVFWRVFGANSMVRVAKKDVDVWCLGFVDGGVNPRASIVIGGSQMEDNLLQFDVGLKRFGFSSSVLVHGTTCANFNVDQM